MAICSKKLLGEKSTSEPQRHQSIKSTISLKMPLPEAELNIESSPHTQTPRLQCLPLCTPVRRIGWKYKRRRQVCLFPAFLSQNSELRCGWRRRLGEAVQVFEAQVLGMYALALSRLGLFPQAIEKISAALDLRGTDSDLLQSKAQVWPKTSFFHAFLGNLEAAYGPKIVQQK